MRDLFKKAKPVFFIMVSVYILSFGTGLLAGKLNIVDFNTIRNSQVLKFNSTLEYKVPGYGDLLESYKSWHKPTMARFLTRKDPWDLGLLIFFNNFVMANLTMFVRALFLVPLVLYPYNMD